VGGRKAIGERSTWRRSLRGVQKKKRNQLHGGKKGGLSKGRSYYMPNKKKATVGVNQASKLFTITRGPFQTRLTSYSISGKKWGL